MMTDDSPAATLTDLEYAINLILTGNNIPSFAARVMAETKRITDEIEGKHGVLNIAVDLIRDARNAR